MGESMGGAVVLLLHRKKPEYWDGAVLMAPMCKVCLPPTASTNPFLFVPWLYFQWQPEPNCALSVKHKVVIRNLGRVPLDSWYWMVGKGGEGQEKKRREFRILYFLWDSKLGILSGSSSHKISYLCHLADPMLETSWFGFYGSFRFPQPFNWLMDIPREIRLKLKKGWVRHHWCVVSRKWRHHCWAPGDYIIFSASSPTRP